MEVELDVPATPQGWREWWDDWKQFMVHWLQCQEDELFKVGERVECKLVGADEQGWGGRVGAHRCARSLASGAPFPPVSWGWGAWVDLVLRVGGGGDASPPCRHCLVGTGRQRGQSCLPTHALPAPSPLTG